MTPNEIQPYTNSQNAPDGCFNSLVTFKDQMDAAKMLSQAQIVPDVFRGKTADCLIALDMAIRMGLSPLQVFQHLYVVKGKPAWSGQFYIACINKCGRFTPIQYDEKTEGGHITRCRAFATEKASNAVLYGPWVTLEMVRSEGWGPKWKTMPEVMFRYRAAAFFAKTICPDVTLGISMVEEVIDAESSESTTGKMSDTKAALASVAAEATEVETEVTDSSDDLMFEPYHDDNDKPGEAAQTFIDRIDSVENSNALKAVGDEVAGSNLSAKDKAHVRRAYMIKQAEFAANPPKQGNQNFDDLKSAIQKASDVKKINTLVNAVSTALSSGFISEEEHFELLTIIDERAEEIGKESTPKSQKI